MLSEEILTSFTYVLPMKLVGNRYTINYTCKMERGRRTDAGSLLIGRTPD